MKGNTRRRSGEGWGHAGRAVSVYGLKFSRAISVVHGTKAEEHKKESDPRDAHTAYDLGGGCTRGRDAGHGIGEVGVGAGGASRARKNHW